MSIGTLLNNLNKVKRTGDGKFMACCPAHNDKTASLVITELPDGRILLNCFAGCDPYSILSSIGLDWSAVMPEKTLGGNLKPEKKILYATEALQIVRFEAQVVCLIALDIKNKGHTSEEMSARLLMAIQTINKALEASK